MNKFAIITASVLGAGAIAFAGTSVVSAATNTSTNPNVGTSGIPRTVFKTERQTAAASVLNTSTDNIAAAHKNHTFAQLLKNAGLTHKTYDQKLKAQITSDLEAKGYSQQQVTIALQRKQINHLHHKIKADKKADKLKS